MSKSTQIHATEEGVDMSINAKRISIAAALAASILWVVCSLIVLILPDLSMNATGYMMHSDMSGAHWQLHLPGVMAGLVLWSVLAGATAWLVATLYKKIS